MRTGQYRFRLGSFACTVLNDFTNPQPFGQLVAGVSENQLSEALRKQGLPTDRALLDTNILLIRMGDRLLLVDSGRGAEGDLFRRLRSRGIAPTDIDLVIITHTDSDHTGGLLDEEGFPSFPNAQYAMTGSAWNRWTSDSYQSQLPDDWVKFVQSATALLEEKTILLDVDSEIAPGLRVVDAPGHREGHMALALSSDGAEMLHVADGILHPIFIMNPQWHSPIDSYPAEAAETRWQLLSLAAESNMLIASAHLPFPGLGRVKQGGQGWDWQPIG
ncbi:MAG: MBL fold metallo-hydrolase [Nitrospiraceae bacterium]